MARRLRPTAYYPAITKELLRKGRLTFYDLMNLLGLSPSYARELLKGYAKNENVRRELEGRGYRLVLEDGELILEEVVINSSQNRD
jgi:predicted transcriptional regulator